MEYDVYAPDLFDAADAADGIAIADGSAISDSTAASDRTRADFADAAGTTDTAHRFDLTEPPRRPVRARRPLTPQALVERADLAPYTAEAETVLRIYRRRREQHAALYVAEMREIGRAHV